MRLLGTALLLWLAMILSPTAALGATPAVTTQAQAADAAFLAYAPPPPEGAGALCLVDTGVNANADTQPGLISATAVEGGSGADVDPLGHGTEMAMIAGGAGHGMIGAWPQIKIVSVRATETPSPGQEPTFEFPDYTQGIADCLESAKVGVHAIDLALSSTIQPSPDEREAFEDEVAEADARNIAIVAAAGNTPGPIELPASEPGVLAVGAGDPNNAICSFSATEGLTFYAPGCGLDEAEFLTDEPVCCGNGTSQASAFAAAVVVALMSYEPAITYAKAEQLLVSTAVDGQLNATKAFEAAGLSAVVAAGNANIPQAAPAPTTTTPATATTPAATTPVATTPAPTTPATTTTPETTTPPTTAPEPTTPATTATTTVTTTRPRLKVTEARWKCGVLTLVLRGLSRGRVRVQLDFARHHERVLFVKHERSSFHTARPRLVSLRLMAGKRLVEGPITVHVT